MARAKGFYGFPNWWPGRARNQGVPLLPAVPVSGERRPVATGFCAPRSLGVQCHRAGAHASPPAGAARRPGSRAGQGGDVWVRVGPSVASGSELSASSCHSRAPGREGKSPHLDARTRKASAAALTAAQSTLTFSQRAEMVISTTPQKRGGLSNENRL